MPGIFDVNGGPQTIALRYPRALAQRIESAALGPKKWDTYLVLLTQEKSAEDDDVTRDLYAINFDRSRLRRIAHTGVDPT